ncbi:glycosyltransferase family 61 protein [Paenibacillus sp. SAF-054]|uniref:glycosyltransferase family 61 protein n=1 Tax=unclassified Paenibacillus TaxID=185978 RepID=UPI003F8013F5
MDPSETMPCGYFEYTKDWIRDVQRREDSRVAFQLFDFGGEADFHAPRSVEPWIHPYLTAYRMKPEDGFVASIPEGRIWGQSGAVLTPDGKLLGDVSPEYDEVLNAMLATERHPIFRQRNLPGLQKIGGTTAALAYCGGYNYFHWMYDVIARWGMLIESGIAYDQVVVNANPYRAFVGETLAMLGVAEDKLVRTHPGLYLQSERLVVPSLIMSSHYPQWATGMLRKLFLPNQETNGPPHERIYVCRQRASVRRVINEPEIIEFLRELGFHSLLLEDMSTAEQIGLFASARVIVGAHGAGLTNLAFCHPGTKVIEMFHPGHVMPVYWMISNHNQLDYYMMYGREASVEGAGFAGLEDIRIDIGTLRKTLQLAGVG